MFNTIQWLLEGEPLVRYHTMVDLQGKTVNDDEVLKTKVQILKDAKIQTILAELAEWPLKRLTSHKSADHPIHKLSFIADIGLDTQTPQIKEITDKILQHQSEEGPFQVIVNVPQHFGGTGKDELGWALCDAPLVLYSLIKMGLYDHPQIQKALQFLIGTIQENGYPCKVSKELGKFRGPGKKTDPCPYANLLMLKVFSQVKELHTSKECKAAAETQLGLWSSSKEQHPYMFYAGTDFRKLKAPFIWYDILHVLDILTRFKDLHEDKRLVDMLHLLQSKANINGQFTPESIWKAWSDYDFGQKKQPSRWLTLLAWRILKRM